MKKYIFYVIAAFSVITNFYYIYYLQDKKRHVEEFLSLFKVEDISYENGLKKFAEQLKEDHIKKPHHLIHIWDTTHLEFGDKIPYILNFDNSFKSLTSNNLNCILMSAMHDETIKICLDSRGINFKSFIIMNNMGDFISGVCKKYGRKTKPTAATMLIDENGNILYYCDKLKYKLDEDTVLVKAINLLK